MGESGFEAGLAGLEQGAPVGGDEGGPRGDPADAASHPSVSALRARFGEAVLHHTVMAGDEHVVYVAADAMPAIMGWLKSEPDQAYDFLADLTAVDYGGGRPLEVVYQLWSIQHKRALRLKVTLPLDALEVDSVVGLWNAANWLEREVFDLFGVHFRGHPDLRRIMMPENYAEGHPLRKDFPLRGRFSRAEQTRRALSLDMDVHYIPTELAVISQDGRESGERPEEAPSEDELRPDPRRSATGPKHSDDWSLGSEGSAAGGVPGPSGVTE
jgi:NADH-quinone oxidoreductase subunit C